MSLVELLLALVVLSVGILALARLFPSASSSQEQGRLTTSAEYYAQERVERLGTLAWSDTALSEGRHPGGTATEGVGPHGSWRRYYTVTTMTSPLDDLKKVTVTVTWTYQGDRTTRAITYLRR